MKLKLSAIFLLLAFTFCKKDKKDEPEPQQTTPDVGNVAVSYRATVDGNTLNYGLPYQNANGDTFSVNIFKYYISNIQLVKEDGSKFSEGKYHLVDHANNSAFSITGIPAGTYKSMIYSIGVDSLRNVSGVQEGDLAPSKSMFWDWNNGYIFLKLEGTSPQANNPSKEIVFHIGGFKTPYNSIKTMTLTFGQDLVISKNKSPQLKLETNVNELFKNPYLVDFYTYYTVTSPGLQTNLVSNNYQSMISFESIVP